jgi:hypothetical protein
MGYGFFLTCISLYIYIYIYMYRRVLYRKKYFRELVQSFNFVECTYLTL